MVEKLKSRKFIIAILGAILPVVNQELGINLPSEVILGVFGVILSYILGESLIDRERVRNQ